MFTAPSLVSHRSTRSDDYGEWCCQTLYAAAIGTLPLHFRGKDSDLGTLEEAEGGILQLRECLASIEGSERLSDVVA